MKGSVFMNAKMSIEEFRNIKKQLHDAYDEFVVNGSVSNKKHCLDLQKLLLAHDLSDIPFEEWSDVYLLSDGNSIPDFTNTRANIDFLIYEYVGNENFTGCNIRNIDAIAERINPQNFDETTVAENPSLFISDSFSNSFKEKYYERILDLSDVANLSEKQIEELKNKKFEYHMSFDYHFIFKIMTIERAIELYNYREEDFNLMLSTLNYCPISLRSYVDEKRANLLFSLTNANSKDIKDVCFSYLRDLLRNNDFSRIDFSLLPRLFVKETFSFLLEHPMMSLELREKYNNGSLTLEEFMKDDSLAVILLNNNASMVHPDIFFLGMYLGFENLSDVLSNHSDVISYMVENDKLNYLINILKQNSSSEVSFTLAVKKYALDNRLINNSGYQTVNNVKPFPDWMESMNFKMGQKLRSVADLMACDYGTIIYDTRQQMFIDLFGIENLKRFEKKTGFFSHKNHHLSEELDNFDILANNLTLRNFNDLAGASSYEKFEEVMANYLNLLRKCGIYVEYDWIQGEFREKHKEIFIDEGAPSILKEAFYSNIITPAFLNEHQEFLPFLLDKDLLKYLTIEIKLIPSCENFAQLYIEKFGNKNFLELILKYSTLCDRMFVDNLDSTMFNNKEEVDKAFRACITKKILQSDCVYTYLENVPEYYAEYPDMFVESNMVLSVDKFSGFVSTLFGKFYTRSLSFEDIKKCPKLKDVLKNKNLYIAFGQQQNADWIIKARQKRTRITNERIEIYSDLELLRMYGNEIFLELCSKYGKYLEGVNLKLHQVLTVRDGKYVNSENRELSYDELVHEIEKVIANECKWSERPYDPASCPEFLKRECPELFLDDNAPDTLKSYFYDMYNRLNFEILKENPDWLFYLKDKSIITPMLHTPLIGEKIDIIKYFDFFGDKAFKLGINKAETVDMMIAYHEVDLMKKWYDKTGGKFIPYLVIMQNFSLEDADKFLTSTSNWSKLMKIEHFAKDYESREAMLKLAYIFGAFDQDQVGYKRVETLLSGIPTHIKASHKSLMERISRLKGYEHIQPYADVDSVATGGKEYKLLWDSLKSEGVNINPDVEMFSQIYRRNDDGSYTLSIDPQRYPKSALSIRKLLDKLEFPTNLTPDRAHQLCGRFEMRYDKDFREFFIANMDEILNNSDYTSLIASIQQQFPLIKVANSNRALTLELAASYVKSNQYNHVNPGNERVAEISAIAGYSQAEFHTLQKIYNYGKQRSFSSIPRIKNTYENYSYEMLRLDDPLALAIGTLTDCCQALGDVAELCMEHSMVDKNGRVFVVRDDAGNIVSQSWVWRNKDVICFDNVEIPDRALNRALKLDLSGTGIKFSDKIYDIYKQAAKELIEQDAVMYKKLLDDGMITEEQYQGLRLGKVTVGLGYNDIAESIKRKSMLDTEKVSTPLPFTEPVKLSRGLYINDSKTQYVLEKRDDRVTFIGETLPIYNDEIEVYDNTNFTDKMFLTLQKLEILTKGATVMLNMYDEDIDSDQIVSKIAKKYDLDPLNCKIIMNPNFAIIYDISGDIIKIGDLFFNTFIDNKEQQLDITEAVVMQIKLALETIANDKTVDVSRLAEHQVEMYEQAINLSDEMYIERGIKNGK